MLLEHEGFQELLRQPSWNGGIVKIVINESHCIPVWGAKFRKSCAGLKTLHVFVPLNIPVLVTLAIMTSTMVEQVQSSLEMSKLRMFYLNLGNSHLNIMPIVIMLTGRKETHLEKLNFLVDKTLQFYKQSSIGRAASGSTPARGASFEIAKEAELTTAQQPLASPHVTSPFSPLAPIRNAAMTQQAAAETQMDRMQIWMKNVESESWFAPSMS